MRFWPLGAVGGGAGRCWRLWTHRRPTPARLTLNNPYWDRVNVQLVITRGSDCDSRGDGFYRQPRTGDAPQPARGDRRPEWRHVAGGATAIPRSRRPASGPGGQRRRCSRGAVPRRTCRRTEPSRLLTDFAAVAERVTGGISDCRIARRTFGVFDGPRPRDCRHRSADRQPLIHSRNTRHRRFRCFRRRRRARIEPAPVPDPANDPVTRSAGSETPDTAPAGRIADPAPRA